jgi:hypothetical protein
MFQNNMDRHYDYRVKNIRGVKIPESDKYIYFGKCKTEIETIKCLEKYIYLAANKTENSNEYESKNECSCESKDNLYSDTAAFIIDDRYILESIDVDEHGIMHLHLVS